MAKEKFNEKEQALKDIQEAKENLERANMLFDYAESDYFEIANMELTIAQMKYNLAIKKAQKLCSNGDLPLKNYFISAY